MTKFTFLTKFHPIVGILSVTLLLIFAACVKEVANNQAQFETEKADLLKAKGEMTTSFKSMADAVRVTGKKYFGSPHDGVASVEKEAFLRDLTAEMTRRDSRIQTNPLLRDKVWNPKKESLTDFVSANGASEKLIVYSNKLKDNLEAAAQKFSPKIESGDLDVKVMLGAMVEVYQDMEKQVISDKNLTESEKLTLLAATTAGMELVPAWTETMLDSHFNQVNLKESWNWLRKLGNFILTVAVVVIVVIVVCAVAATLAGAGLIVGGMLYLGGIVWGAEQVANAVWGCSGICEFSPDDCYCD
jgi:hypothetical protein